MKLPFYYYFYLIVIVKKQSLYLVRHYTIYNFLCHIYVHLLFSIDFTQACVKTIMSVSILLR